MSITVRGGYKKKDLEKLILKAIKGKKVKEISRFESPFGGYCATITFKRKKKK